MARTPRASAPVSVDVSPASGETTLLPALAAQARAAMENIGYDLPYDRERVVQETRFYMAQSAEAMLEAGRRLLVIKEFEPHGEFEAILRDRLGIPERTARRMMQSAVKYLLNPALESKRPALAVLGKTKLFELMTEEDEDLAALADGGTLAGHSLDEIDRMTSRELKEALRDAKEDSKAKDELLRDKNAKLDAAKAKAKRIAAAPVDEKLAEITREAAEVGNTVIGMVRGDLRQALVALADHERDNTALMAGLVAQVLADCRALQQEFGLPEVDAGETAWTQD